MLEHEHPEPDDEGEPEEADADRAVEAFCDADLDRNDPGPELITSGPLPMRSDHSARQEVPMTIGVSILIGAVGAILRYAVADNIDDVDLRMVGLILMIAGAVGLVIGLVTLASHRRGSVIVDRPGVVHPVDEPRV